MSHPDIIRAWKDPEYRQSLSAEDRAALPANPAGLVDLAEAELAAAVGGVQVFGTAVSGGMPIFYTTTENTCGYICGRCTPGFGFAP